MVASSFDARVPTQIGKDRMELSPDFEAIRARRDSFSSSKAQSETLCGVLRSGPASKNPGRGSYNFRVGRARRRPRVPRVSWLSEPRTTPSRQRRAAIMVISWPHFGAGGRRHECYIISTETTASCTLI